MTALIEAIDRPTIVPRWMNSRRLSRPRRTPRRRRAAAASSNGEPCPARDSPSVLILQRARLVATSTSPASFATTPPPATVASCQTSECLGTVLAAFPTVNEPEAQRWARRRVANGDCAILPACASPRIRLDRLVAAARPAVPGRLGPRPAAPFAATIVRVETDEGVVGIGSGDTMDGFEAFEHLFVGQDPLAIARHVRVARDDRLPRRPLLAARGRAVGHRRPGRGLPVATLFGGATDGIPAYASCGMLLPPGGPGRVGAAPPRRGLPGAEDPGRSAPARGGPRLRRGDAARGRRLDGDHGRPQPGLADGRRHDAARSIPWPRARSPSQLAELDVLWLEEPLAGTDLRGLAALRASGTGHPDRGRRDDPDVRRAAWRAVDADAFDVHQPDVVLAAGMLRTAGRSPSSPSRATAGSRRTRGRTGSGCSPTSTSRPASAAGRSSSSRTTRRAGPPSGATPCSPSRSGPVADGILRVPARPGSGSSSTRRRSSGTRHDRPTRAPGRPPTTGSRAPPRSSPGPSCSSTAGSSRRRRAGRSTTSPAATARPSPRSPRAAPRTSTAPSPPRARRSTTAAGPTSRRPTASASCSGSPS